MRSRAARKGQGREVDRVVSAKWFNGKRVFWPNKVLKAMKKQTSPEKRWMKFDCMKTKFLSGKIF